MKRRRKDFSKILEHKRFSSKCVLPRVSETSNPSDPSENSIHQTNVSKSICFAKYRRFFKDYLSFCYLVLPTLWCFNPIRPFKDNVGPLGVLGQNFWSLPQIYNVIFIFQLFLCFPAPEIGTTGLLLSIQ